MRKISEWLKERGLEAVQMPNVSSVEILDVSTNKAGVRVAVIKGDDIIEADTDEKMIELLEKVIPKQ